jgi:hypothetical protein
MIIRSKSVQTKTNGPLDVVGRPHVIECLGQIEGRDRIGQHSKTDENPHVGLK